VASKSDCLYCFNTESTRSTREETVRASNTFDVSFGEGESSSPFEAKTKFCPGAQNLRRFETTGTAVNTNLAAFLVILVRDHSQA